MLLNQRDRNMNVKYHCKIVCRNKHKNKLYTHSQQILILTSMQFGSFRKCITCVHFKAFTQCSKFNFDNDDVRIGKKHIKPNQFQCIGKYFMLKGNNQSIRWNSFSTDC